MSHDYRYEYDTECGDPDQAEAYEYEMMHECLRPPELMIFDAIEKNDVQAVKNYIAMDRDVLMKTERYYTPLHMAFQYEDKELVEVMLKNEADMFAKDAFGCVPFSYAFLGAPGTSLELVKLVVSLLKRKDLVKLLNTPDESSLGQTCLHYAVNPLHWPAPSLEMVQLLLQNGARPIRDIMKLYPSETCALGDVKELLEKYEKRAEKTKELLKYEKRAEKRNMQKDFQELTLKNRE